MVKILSDVKGGRVGKISRVLESLPTGGSVDFKGPIGKLKYLRRGLYSIDGSERESRHFVMIGAGSGIAPIFPILRAILKDLADKTKCTLVDCNRGVGDNLCKVELDALVEASQGQAKAVYTLTGADQQWAGLRGKISAGMLRRHCERCEDNIALVCGPRAFEDDIRDTLKAQGWLGQQIVTF